MTNKTATNTDNKYFNIEKIKRLLKIENLTDLVKFVSVFAILFFMTGFLVWNLFLSMLGFDEYAPVQTRFISTGMMFFLVTIVFYFILKLLIIGISRVFHHRFSCALYWCIVWCIVFVLWFLLYTLWIFPSIPAYLGGGYPRLVSIIATEQEIESLSKFGIEKGENSTIQTANLCIVYENNESVIVLRSNRILKLYKTNFKGFGSLPDLFIYTSASNSDTCGYLLKKRWIKSILLSWLGYRSEHE